jgi:plastocyanin
MKISVLPALLVFAACGGDDGVTPADPDAEPVVSHVTEVSCAGATIAATVTTLGFAYSPETTTIGVGDVVEFTPDSSHDVNGEDPGLTVPLGGDLCFSFDEAGTYDFHCNPHGFQGSVVVQ